jgi:hypothetical protein
VDDRALRGDEPRGSEVLHPRSAGRAGHSGERQERQNGEPGGDQAPWRCRGRHQGSNSGAYFQGLYEIQILDSFGKTALAYGDNGGVYARYIDGKSVGGAPPRVNASKAPGEWQSFHVWFRAPRFDAAGKKIRNTRFEKVIHNGVTIHENVEVEGPTRASMSHAEAPLGPLMLQGDHGPVAFRRIEITPLK